MNSSFGSFGAWGASESMVNAGTLSQAPSLGSRPAVVSADLRSAVAKLYALSKGLTPLRKPSSSVRSQRDLVQSLVDAYDKKSRVPFLKGGEGRGLVIASNIKLAMVGIPKIVDRYAPPTKLYVPPSKGLLQHLATPSKTPGSGTGVISDAPAMPTYEPAAVVPGADAGMATTTTEGGDTTTDTGAAEEVPLYRKPIVLALAAALVASGGYYLYKQSGKKKPAALLGAL